jgi:hypothetical protein
MVARINGAAWTATCITTASFANAILSLGATDGTQSIGLSVSYVGLGEYSMTPLDPLNPPKQLMIASGTVNLIPQSSASWVASSATPNSSGTLNLTAFSSSGGFNVGGTFTFTAKPVTGTGAAGDKVVTNGGFTVTF